MREIGYIFGGVGGHSRDKQDFKTKRECRKEVVIRKR